MLGKVYNYCSTTLPRAPHRLVRAIAYSALKNQRAESVTYLCPKSWQRACRMPFLSVTQLTVNLTVIWNLLFLFIQLAVAVAYFSVQRV